MTGASRGIGKAIALKAAKDGANVVIAAKTATAHPKLPGTIYTAAEEIEKAGGKCLPCVVDVRDEVQVRGAVEEAVKKFGGIDILVNNASAISLTPTDQTDMKRYDLMHQINTRGTFLATKECLPYLKKSNHAHVLNISPPLNMETKWFSNHVAYTMAKYGMSLCVLGHHEEFRPLKIAVNALWPRTAIKTAAMEMLSGGGTHSAYRNPDIMADAAYAVLSQDPAKCTGNFFIDERVLFEAGVKNFDAYACDPNNKDNLMLDFFLNEDQAKPCVGTGSGETGMEQGLAQGPFGKKKEAPSGPVENVEGIFRVIEASLSEDLVSSTKAVFAFNVTGKEEGKWFVDLKNGSGQCGKGEPPTAADATLTMDGKNFFAMFTGKTKPATAYMLGKLKISGNLQKAMKLEKLMGKLKAKM